MNFKWKSTLIGAWSLQAGTTRLERDGLGGEGGEELLLCSCGTLHVALYHINCAPRNLDLQIIFDNFTGHYDDDDDDGTRVFYIDIFICCRDLWHGHVSCVCVCARTWNHFRRCAYSNN